MQLSPLRLEDYLLKELRFALNSPLIEIPSPSIKYDPLDIEVDADTQMRNNDPYSWRSQVVVRSKDQGEGTYPYTFHLIYVGFFKVSSEFPPDRIEQMAKANCPALLYSAAREALMYLTGRGRYPSILLPSLTFIEPQKSSHKTLTKSVGKKAAKKASKKR